MLTLLELQHLEFKRQNSERTNGVSRVLKSFGNLKRMKNNTAKASEGLCTAVSPQIIIYSVRTTHRAHHILNCFPSLTINCHPHRILATSKHRYLNLCNICCRHGALFNV